MEENTAETTTEVVEEEKKPERYGGMLPSRLGR
mgnify:CR=1 FL=1